MGRLPDMKILVKAKEEGRILLTHDLDFGELLAASGGSLPSVIISVWQICAPKKFSGIFATFLRNNPSLWLRGRCVV